MMKIGIPTYYIAGYSANENHAWALVELDDGFYNVDVTGNDLHNQIIYKYFNINDEMIKQNYQKRGLSAKLTKQNGRKYLNTLSSLYK